MMLSFFLLLANVVVLVGASDGEWCYKHCGNTPSHWGDHEKNCNGDRQSPINIDTKHVIGKEELTDFMLGGFDKTNAMTQLTNNGHSVKCDLDDGEVEVSGGGLPHEYSALQFHFHWGRDDLEHFPGSEHSIDGHRYPMEMHIVTRRKDKINTTVALEDPDGLAVLGFFIDVKEGDETGMPLVWNNFTKLIDDIPMKGNTTSMENLTISINDLLEGVDLTKYYRYNGSLTTPKCNEAVVWTVFQEPISISKDLILRFTHKTGVTDIYRPQQSLNNRKIYASPNVGAATSHEAGHEWCYDGCEEHGRPSHWADISGASCGEKRQSPINIDSNHAEHKPDLGSFSFSGFSNKHTMDYLVNNGHTVKAVLKSGMVEVGGGGLDDIYSTLQFHFHWGNSSNHGLDGTSHRSDSGHSSSGHSSTGHSSTGHSGGGSSSSGSSSSSSSSSSEGGGSKSGGSEHALDSHVYPMEMHIVSMRKDLTLDQAKANPTGFAVLGFFIQETDEEDKPAIWKNFTDHLEMIKNKDSTIDLHHDISLDALIGSVNRTKYYRYSGSLTTPSCNEAVVWTIFEEPIKVSKNLVQKFSMHTGLNNVFRSVQPLNNRKVYKSMSTSSSMSSSAPTCLLSVSLILSALFTCLWFNHTQ